MRARVCCTANICVCGDICAYICTALSDGAPVIPISAQLKYNIDVVCEYLCKKIPVPKRDFMSPCHMIVIRSFDVNKPGAEVGWCRLTPTS